MKRIILKPYQFIPIGWNDYDANCFDFFRLFLGRITNPHRRGNESCPEGIFHIGMWSWKNYFQQVYGKENVEKVTPDYISAREVYEREYIPIPAETDYCYIVNNGVVQCNNACCSLKKEVE